MTDPIMTRFPILFTGLSRGMTVFGLRRNNSYADVGHDTVSVRMGWAFRATIDRSSIVSVAEDHNRVLGWGVHGWRGRWLVNGSSTNLVRIEIDPPARARVTGVPVRLRTLRVSVEEPAALIDELG